MKKPLMIKCPRCGAQHEWREDNPYRPFCSASCKNADFIAWAKEEQVIPGNPMVDDLMSEDVEKNR